MFGRLIKPGADSEVISAPTSRSRDNNILNNNNNFQENIFSDEFEQTQNDIKF